MMRRDSRFALAVLALIATGAPAAARPALEAPALFRLPPKAPPPKLVFSYRGWRVDASRTAKAQPPSRTVRAVMAQIDIVEGLGLRPEVIGFMRAQPVLCDGASNATLEAGDYAPGRGVVLHVRRLDRKKPALLYGLLKAYMAQRLPGGASNPEVAVLRNAAAGRHAWPKTARMLQSNDEFFALSAAAYLYGAITREPYTRADLRKTEPACYQWLANLFDGGRARS
jgi:hypothetical protein